MPFTSQDFRRAMGAFATGVTVVTTRLEGKPHGFTANSFTSLSLEPPLVLVCVDKKTTAHPMLTRSRIFAVNILAADQEEVSRKFADKAQEATRFDGLRTATGVTGAPLIEGSLAYADCRVVAVHDGGDHSIFVGLVEDLATWQDKPPLLFHKGRYRGLAP
ncbi:MAG: flavin reductase family protein [Euryarchaeota archaeon]|nr:flavin reductase family protein [Euryarchaeota archaeon]